MLVSTILPLIPEHITYCEPFFGGGAIFFAKEKSKVEIINDVDQFVINFYWQVQNNFDNLNEKVSGTAHSRRQYMDAKLMYENQHLFTDLERAWAFWILCNQGYAGKIGSWAYGTIDNSCEKKTANIKRQFALGELADRLDLVQIECNDVLHILKMRDREQTFFYLDPPYFNSNMGHYGGYKASDFEALLQACSTMQGKFLLSSYPSDLLRDYTERFGWYQIEMQQITRASKNRKMKTEVLTSNYPF